ncbi:MAG: sigma-70 family RNA polymerase sigma factor [Ignavibacteriota bacterium]
MDSLETLRYVDDLFRYAMALARCRAQAEDLVQETYLRALGAVDRLGPGSNLKVWLFTILRNVWINQLRRRRCGPRFVELDGRENFASAIAESNKDPYSLYECRAEQARTRDAIARLPDHFREIVVLREYDELSYEEISGVLNCPLGTVMSRLRRARAKLRQLLVDESEAAPRYRNPAP